MKSLIAALVAIIGISCAPAQAQDRNRLAQRVAAPHRTAGNVARDGFRHPVAVLTFFGIEDNSAVVEILPGSGGYLKRRKCVKHLHAGSTVNRWFHPSQAPCSLCAAEPGRWIA